tara:strand:+ start:703 stop:1113 length:411 start_codon:yes stop_codon:yes gene_type:complete
MSEEEQVAPPLYEEEEVDIFENKTHIMFSGLYFKRVGEDEVACNTVFFKKIYKISETPDENDCCRRTHLANLYDEMQNSNIIEISKEKIKAAIAEINAEWTNKQLVLALKENRWGNRTEQLDIYSITYVINYIEIY